MDQLAAQLQFTVNIIQQHLPMLLWILAAIWAVNIANWSLGSPLFILGIFPRKPLSLLGIFFAPWLHGDFNHLFYNSIPLVLLASGALVTGWDNFLEISAIIVVISGLLIWIGGRPGIHIGASALIMGYWSYLLVLAYWLDTGVAFFVGFIAVYYFGSLVANLFPSEARVSWEGHIYGFVAGLIAAWWQFSSHAFL
jgi:membrane associated rhomboid family serine protease